MVGRVSCQKAPDNFIKAAKIIKKHIPNAYFIIVGDGDLSTFVYDYAKKYKFNDDISFKPKDHDNVLMTIRPEDFEITDSLGLINNAVIVDIIYKGIMYDIKCK